MIAALPSTTVALDPRALTSPEQIAAQLTLLTRREADLTLALNALVSDRAQVDGALLRLGDLAREVDVLSADVDGSAGSMGVSVNGLGSVGVGVGVGVAVGISPARSLTHGASPAPGGLGLGLEDDPGLVSRVSRVWETSERVGGKVRKLDDEIGRVREAADVVTEVLELKNSLQTLSAAIDKADWESASRACRRAMSVRLEVTEGGFAGAAVPTPQSPLPPPQQLEELRNVLLATFKREFDAAAERKDEQEVSRYFRLWPGIGAEDEGLAAYGDFVVGLVKMRSAASSKPSSSLYYLASVTSLLESIAHIIDQHQPVVNKYYGPRRMRTVVGRLVAESDRVVRNLVEGWEEERRVGRLISDTKASRFALLANPSLLPPLFPSLAAASASSHAPSAAAATALSSLANTTSNLSSALQSYAPYAPGRKNTAPATPVPQPAEQEEAGPDPRDVDRVLGELVALGGRWALFRRFVQSRLAEDEWEEGGEGDQDNANASANANATAPAEMDMEVITASGSQRAFENLLKVYYEPLEMWYLRSSVEKAHRLDAPDMSSRPHVSSILDDTFYLIKVVLTRVLSSGSVATVHTLRERIAKVLDKDYCAVLARKVEFVLAPSTTASTTLYDRGDKDKRERERDQREALIILLNDLDMSADYMDRLLRETRATLPAVYLDLEVGQVHDELELLSDSATRFRTAARTGMEQLFNTLVRPRLRPLLDECLRDVSYVLDEDRFADAEEADIVRRRFARAWDGVVDGFKDAFTDHNYQAFFNMTVETLVRPWEKMVMGMQFTELGAIRYERDIRGVANYLSTQANYGGARDKFTRLQQIATVLNLDADDDPDEFFANSGIPWRLSRNEYNTVVGLRQ